MYVNSLKRCAFRSGNALKTALLARSVRNCSERRFPLSKFYGSPASLSNCSTTSGDQRNQQRWTSSAFIALSTTVVAVTTAIGLAIFSKRDDKALCKDKDESAATPELGSVVKGLPTITASDVSTHKTPATGIWVSWKLLCNR